MNFLFIACAARTPITTWLVVPEGLEHKTGIVDDIKPISDANGYRCYSEEDDLIWRERCAQCCAQAGL